MRNAWSVVASSLPVVSTAIHAGHDLRPAVAERMALDDATRRREEDPFTDEVARAGGAAVVVHRSRFEVDLNRPRQSCVYLRSEDSWGLDVWHEPPTEEEAERSRRIHDAFYIMLASVLDDLATRGRFVVLDLHSYNHRRGGPQAPPEPIGDNPEVNVGTGSLDRERWGELVGLFIEHLRGQVVDGHQLDVRENVRFKGGHLSAWVHERYEGRGCALAVELKKVFMDEWTGVPHRRHLGELAAAVTATHPLLLRAVAGERA